MGRDSTYTPELADEICARLETGESLRSICRDLHMPAEASVRRWVVSHPEFAQRYSQARDMGLEAMAEDLFEIADDGSNDFTERENERTGRVSILPDHEHINRSRLRVDTRKWYLSKLAPKRYGDRIAMEHSGPDGGPIKTEVTDERRAALTLALLRAVGSPLLGQRIDGPPAVGPGTGEPPAA